MINSIFKKVLSDIPNSATGMDRQAFISMRIISLTQEEKKAMQKHFEKYLLYMRQQNASDIEFGGPTAQNSIWLRIYGKKQPRHELGKITQDQADVICQCLLTETQRKKLFTHLATDFSYELIQNGTLMRWRATMYFDLDHLALNMRTISDTIYPLHTFGFHPNIERTLSLMHEKQGLILITGITGSGKSTTMDSIVDANNQTSPAHIVIIGDPIEHVHHSKKCIVRHREVGRDVLSFKDGAIQALRQDPDIIVVGEMRDPETIMTCLEITDTGHKVFSTLHTASAVETIDRIVAECPPAEQERIRNRLADVLRVVISQKLVPTLDEKVTLAKEVLIVTTSVKAAIRNNNTHEIYQMINQGGKLGMITLEQDLVRLFNQRTISNQTAYDFANNKHRIKELLQHKF